jgi:hypothetical protein
MQIFQQLEAGGWSRCREGEGRGGKAKRGPVALVLRETEAANLRASPSARTRDVDVIGARNKRAVSHAPWAVMRLAFPLSLFGLQRSRVFCILLFFLCFARFSGLVLLRQEPRSIPSTIHRPSTFPLQRHVPPFPSQQLPPRRPPTYHSILNSAHSSSHALFYSLCTVVIAAVITVRYSS